MAKRIFAGPWVGEFGWELFCWQGWLRKQARDVDEMIVASRPDMEYLYRDFCTEFIPVDSPPTSSNERCDGFELPCLYRDYPDHEWCNPLVRRAVMQPLNIPVLADQEFIRFGTHRKKPRYDIIFHARSTAKARTQLRNWPLDRWEALREKLSNYRIASIGSMTGAMHVPGTVDLRHQNLQQTCTALRNAKLAVGPSSGPMHLASLCGTPQLVWSEPRNKVRYVKHWNPHNTKVYFLELWKPKVAHVLAECPLYTGPESDPVQRKRYRKHRRKAAWKRWGHQLLIMHPEMKKRVRTRRKRRK